MGRIKQITDSVNQKGRKLLIPYLVAGDPNKETTIELMHALVSNGADIIELGIPFSDPSSDGEVIQSGIERSLRKGTSLNDTLDIVSKFSHNIKSIIKASAFSQRPLYAVLNNFTI